MADPAVAYFASDTSHVGPNCGQEHLGFAGFEWFRAEHGRHQRVLIEVTLERQALAEVCRLPVVPDGVQRLHVFAHARTRAAPLHGETFGDVRLDL